VIPRADELHPVFAPIAAEFWQVAADAGLDLVLVHAWRDPAVQARLYAQGRTAPGRIVTWAQPGDSPHNVTIYGRPASMAIDVAPRHVLRLKDWAPADPAWQQLGAIARQIPGAEWGGDWSPRRRDLPHIQRRDWRSFLVRTV
jgi:peptidoglycan LD-endopeptidase CwlK